MKKISILGSTGSIGRQTLDVIRVNKDKFEIIALSAHSNIDILLEQIIEFKPKVVCVFSPKCALELKDKLSKDQKIDIVDGMQGLVHIATLNEVDVVLTAVVGMIGLIPTLKAIQNNKTIALANKETLVTAGNLVMSEAKKYGVSILPVDSEHSAIFQCLNGEMKSDLDKIILTASGGPFRNKKKEDLIEVTKNEALKHPNWSMGRKISIDSATLMNKGLEVIEAKWLFDVMAKDIDVIVHPQSIVHSMVQFKDSSIIAQLGVPDMKLPIQYALAYPGRIKNDFERLDLSIIANLTFEKPDMQTFPCLKLAYDALKSEGTYTTVLNAANEIVVSEFLQDNIKFYDIPMYIEMALQEHKSITSASLEEILEVDQWSRDFIYKSIKIGR